MKRSMVVFAVVLASVFAGGAAHAFCGFYVSGADGALFNDATMVVMMREGKRTVLSMQNNYKGPPEDFAMVVPVPVVLKKDDVKTLDDQSFADVDRLSAPRLVEYWERDPCFEPYDEMESVLDGLGDDMMYDTQKSSAATEERQVRIEAQFKVGEYDVVILGADDSSALDTWLRANNYKIPQGAEPVLRPYIEGGMYFFVAKVDVDKVKFADGRAKLSPLRFHYDTETFSLPVRLGLLNANGPQDLIVHILARGQRYEVANMPNVTIPTNLGVSSVARDQFGSFYAALFDRTLATTPRAVVTEYAWASGSCDPCPGPALQPEHLNLFGLDTLANQDPWGWVLTRLHARYSKGELKDDLVFAAAPPIVGGREIIGAGGELEHGSSPASDNNFQGRYIIRNLWDGPINCDNPVRGVWGGPPAGGGQSVRAAEDTAFAPRDAVELTRVLRSPAPEIGLDRGKITSFEDVQQASLPEQTIESACGTCAMTQRRSPVPVAVVVILLGLALVLTRRD